MAQHSYNASDLNSVLQTLSSLAAPASASQNASVDLTESSVPRQRRPEQSQTSRRPQVSPPSTPATDPESITTWPAALRYVMRTVGQNEETQLRIRGLIRSQHSHEQQWWKGREALLQRQRARGDKKKELDAVLFMDTNPPQNPKEDEAELANYDTKVYKASVKMADALVSEMRGLNIPFFVISKDFIKDTSTIESENAPKYDESGPSRYGSPPMTKSELADLQRRMLGLLEDLCKE
ncbi:hypothetical protein N7462_006265 [Penicillium macrosclerotiorum]|uniref:uncharacterized protein n=1 Tax=Penicillium macrosclerotiorum TaxID=303699 RepID=UPI002546AADB|nr:uncharacterized protein N7462_006265 [Penicillium macrosclerotiorum]KAJ5683100.1 hypothetical protein N7462_006265 [Penicillium macrosclerotiorum]